MIKLKYKISIAEYFLILACPDSFGQGPPPEPWPSAGLTEALGQDRQRWPVPHPVLMK
jgi:hypothetical protein